MDLKIIKRDDSLVKDIDAGDGLLSLNKGRYQSRLQELYGHYNIECHCSAEPVTMHIRYVQDSGLFYVADNASSPLHNETCSFATHRKSMNHQSDAVIEEGWEPITDLKLYQSTNTNTEKRQKLNPGSSPINHRKKTPYIRSLFVTLVRNAFLDFSFGNFVYLGEFVDKLKVAKNTKLFDKSIPRSMEVFYSGVSELEEAKKTVSQVSSNSALPYVLWFGLAKSLEVKKGYIYWANGGKSSVKHIVKTPNSDGPFLLMATITKGEYDFRELLIIPIVSTNRVFPLVTSEAREAAELVQRWLYGANKQSNYRYYLQSIVSPSRQSEEPQLVVVKKDKSTSSKVVFEINNQDLSSFTADEITF